MSVSDVLSKYTRMKEGEREKFDRLARLLIEKNAMMNLTAITDEAGVALLHIYDSLALADLPLFDGGGSVIDVGCGGGFPSLPLAIRRSDCRVTANDATLKKLDFVASAANETGCSNLTTLNGRAEELGAGNERESFDFAVARGVARLNVLCEWCLPLVKKGGYFIAMKGEKGEEEAEEAANAISVLGGKLVDIIKYNVPEFDYVHTLVVIKKTSFTPGVYPRANGKIKKKPL